MKSRKNLKLYIETKSCANSQINTPQKLIDHCFFESKNKWFLDFLDPGGAARCMGSHDDVVLWTDQLWTNLKKKIDINVKRVRHKTW